jgi:hypothetical protein
MRYVTECFRQNFDLIIYLFIIYSLLNNCFLVAQTGVEWKDDRWMMNEKDVEGNGHRPNSRYYPGICLKGLRITTETLSQFSRSPGQDLNPGLPNVK